MRGRIGPVVTCVGALIVASVAAPAASAEWLPPIAISEASDHTGAPHVVLDSEGNATAVWDRWNGVDTVVESAYRPAGEAWEAPVDLSEPELEGEVIPGAHDASDPRNAVLGKHRRSSRNQAKRVAIPRSRWTRKATRWSSGEVRSEEKNSFVLPIVPRARCGVQRPASPHPTNMSNRCVTRSIQTATRSSPGAAIRARKANTASPTPPSSRRKAPGKPRSNSRRAAATHARLTWPSTPAVTPR